jgi:C-terminal processing protease CtpA/Prc
VFEEAVAAASLFLEPAQRVAQTVRSGGVQGQPAVIDTTWTAGSFSAEAYTQEALAVPGPLTNRPLVLLVNRSSASASEVLAGGAAGLCREGWSWQQGALRQQTH